MVRYLIITEIRIQSEFAHITNWNLVGGFRRNVGIFLPQSEGITNRYVENNENTFSLHDASIRNVPKYRVMPSEFRCLVHFVRYSSITYVYTDYCTSIWFWTGTAVPEILVRKFWTGSWLDLYAFRTGTHGTRSLLPVQS